MKKAWIIARHEFSMIVRRAWFVVATFLLPVVMLGITMLLSWLAQLEVEKESRRDLPVGVVDLWGGLSTPPPGDVRVLPDEEAATGELRARKIRAYAVVPRDYVESGDVRLVTPRRPSIFTAADEHALVPGSLGRWLVGNVLAQVEPRRVARAQAPYRLEIRYLDSASGEVSSEDPKETLKRSAVAYSFFMLLFISILTASGYLLSGMAEEKEHRVMEMVLSAVTPSELMLGKLIGLGAAGLLQLAIWVTMGVAGAAMLALEVVLEPGLFFFCLAYFLMGYVLYGSLMLGFGSLGTNFRESQQMASIWSFIALSPALILVALVGAPHGTLARVFSFIPFTAPTTMMFRYAIDPSKTPAVDIAASVLILLATTGVAIRLSARLYRAGLLLYGKRPGIREICRWLIASK